MLGEVDSLHVERNPLVEVSYLEIKYFLLHKHVDHQLNRTSVYCRLLLSLDYFQHILYAVLRGRAAGCG
jgi:hypothetical protein